MSNEDERVSYISPGNTTDEINSNARRLWNIVDDKSTRNSLLTNDYIPNAGNAKLKVKAAYDAIEDIADNFYKAYQCDDDNNNTYKPVREDLHDISAVLLDILDGLENCIKDMNSKVDLRNREINSLTGQKNEFYSAFDSAFRAKCEYTEGNLQEVFYWNGESYTFTKTVNEDGTWVIS